MNYTFTGSLGAGFATVSTTDYVVVEFEKDVFEGRFSTNPDALCSLAANSECLSFGLSNIIYFQPAAAISSSALNFALNKIINSAYSLEYVDTSFKIFTLISNRVDAVGNTSITKFSKPSTNISALVTQIDSIYGGDAGINYYIEFKLNSNLPENGLISI